MIELENRSSWPAIGSEWQHRNGNRYIVCDYTNVETTRQDEYPTTIIYQNVENRRKYSRRLIDWERSMRLITQ